MTRLRYVRLNAVRPRNRATVQGEDMETAFEADFGRSSL